MIRSLRRTHRLIIPLIAVGVAILLVAALARPRGPVIGSTPPLDQAPAVEEHDHEGAPAGLDSSTDSEDSLVPVSR